MEDQWHNDLNYFKDDNLILVPTWHTSEEKSIIGHYRFWLDVKKDFQKGVIILE